MMNPSVFILEDEVDSAEMLSSFLVHNDFEVMCTYEGNQAIELIELKGAQIDIAVLDMMVPGKSGAEVCRFLRENPITADVPIIFLTARDKEEHEIEGLRLGADDYIPKPASLNLVLAHIQSLLRRSSRNGVWLGGKNLYLNTETLDVFLNKKKIEVTPTEFQLLQLFLKNPKRVFTRQDILDAIYPEQKDVFDRTVDAHIKNLRLKLQDSGEVIKTVRGMGYGLNRALLETI